MPALARPVSLAGMPFEITLEIRGGMLFAHRTNGPLPDGVYEITGGETDQSTHIAITQRTPKGRFVTSAQHTHEKER